MYSFVIYLSSYLYVTIFRNICINTFVCFILIAYFYNLSLFSLCYFVKYISIRLKFTFRICYISLCAYVFVTYYFISQIL